MGRYQVIRHVLSPTRLREWERRPTIGHASQGMGAARQQQRPLVQTPIRRGCEAVLHRYYGLSWPRERADLVDPNGRPIRVLWLIKCLGFGGAERLLVSAASVRNREDFTYETAYVLPGYNALVPELTAAGVPVQCLGSSDHNSDLRWIPRLRHLLLERHYDILHMHLPMVTGIGRLVSRTLPAGRRPRVISTEHNVWSSSAAPLRWLNGLTYPLNDASLSVSGFVASTLPRRLQSATEVVVHGLELPDSEAGGDVREAVRAELGIRPGDVVVGTVANFRAQKGYQDLLQAAKIVIDRGLPVRFVAVGQGPLEREIRALHHSLDLGDRFILTGFRADALRLLAGFDIFVLASYFEGFPVSVMEAMAAGLPIVATAVGGIPEAITDGVEGFVVPPKRPAELAEALAVLISDEDLRARMRPASRSGSQRFDINVAVRRTEQIYREVLAR
jgi:glycosyltransferase involved in cell wall biosynthesis